MIRSSRHVAMRFEHVPNMGSKHVCPAKRTARVFNDFGQVLTHSRTMGRWMVPMRFHQILLLLPPAVWLSSENLECLKFGFPRLFQIRWRCRGERFGEGLDPWCQ